MKNNDKTSITDLLRIQSLLERDIVSGNVTVFIRTHDKEWVPTKTLKTDPEADASVVILL